MPQAQPVEQNSATEEQPLRPALKIGWLSDVGRVRELNEDALVVVTTSFEQGSEQQTIGVFVVADGMGGHERGELASSVAARTVADELLRRVIAPALHGNRGTAPLHEALSGAVMEAHNRLRRELPGAGTTLTVALVVEDLVAIGHVGDSRAYLLRDGQIEQATKDHSLIARLVEMGHSSAEEASLDPRRNYLLRALGQIESLDIDFQFESFPRGSRLLMCSDGLWGQLSPQELERVFREGDNPQTSCQALIDLANEAGGPDNITAIMVIRQ